jgi:hypothetical protein
MPLDPTATIADIGVEPTYSAREAAALLGRSYSWLDRGLRKGWFTHVDGTEIQPLRTPGHYRRFTVSTLKDIAMCCYRHGWFRWDALNLVLHDLALAAYRDSGGGKLPD